MSKTTITACDMCDSRDDVKSGSYPVQFTTEQTEGRSVKPYLTQQDMDLCAECLTHLVDNLPLCGNGAMGHNTYYWNKKQVV